MEDEIDLRRYVQGVRRYWALIAALTLIAAAMAAVFSLLQHNVFEAVALLSVSAPRYDLQPDSVSAHAPLPVRAYPELAESDDVLAQVLSQTQTLLPAAGSPQPLSLDDLQGQLIAEPASDPSLIRLKAHSADPQMAAQLVNIWAEVFVARAGLLYGQDQANLQLYTHQLADAKTALDDAEGALAAFQSTNQITLLTAQLNSQQASITDYLNRRHGLDLLGQDAGDFVAHLNALPATRPASPVDDLALLAITNRVYGSGSTLPVQMQLAAGQPLVGPTVADQLALANSLSGAIAARLADIDGQVAALQPQILALQGQVAEAQVKEDGLTRARDLASGAYKQLAGQVQAAALVAQASFNTVQIASRADLPGTKIGPHRTINTLLGGLLGFVFGVVLALILSLWRAVPDASGKASDQAADSAGRVSIGPA